jgi:hypothetical protein
MLVVTDHGLLSKGPHNDFTNITFCGDSGATCHMRGSLEGMFNLKPSATDTMAENNDIMASALEGDYKGIVLQKNVLTLQYVL